MWDKASLHDLIDDKDDGLSDDRGCQPRAVHPSIRGRDDRVPASRQRHGRGARPGDAGRAAACGWATARATPTGRWSTSSITSRFRPKIPAYTLRRVWLTKEEEEGYYHGLANEGLWPLCHVTFTRPVFQPEDWEMYRQVNALFGDAVLEEADDRPAFVFIQDYHFALLPRYLKERNPNLIVAQFWHIPWPNRETFRVFPWKEELLDGLLGNDLLGFSPAVPLPELPRDRRSHDRGPHRP